VSLLQRALERSQSAEVSGALVPLQTALLQHPAWPPFTVRRLLSRTPKHLRSGGPKPNPFLPWDPALEVQRLGQGHVVILNKFPVQRGHLLLITQQWQPQAGWLHRDDWQALAGVEADTSGLWFFNSCAAAGASQPHRHLQLLPRSTGEASCPLASRCLAQLDGAGVRWPWAYQLSRRQAAGTDRAAAELEELYRQHTQALGIGDPSHHPVPLHPYNLLFDGDWLMTVRRSREHWAGFSVNALGFAGYLLITDQADQSWLEREGPLTLLQAVATAAEPGTADIR
jgi:ATP adenylyltransferase